MVGGLAVTALPAPHEADVKADRVTPAYLD